MPTTNCNHGHIYLIGVREQVVSDTCKRITLSTTRGDLKAQLHIDRGVRQAVIMLGDEWSEDGFDSQFDVIADELSGLGIGAMSLQYRVPCDCAECAIDVLLLCQYLDDEGISDVVLLGWSYGAAVALAAGSVCRTVRGIAAVSPADISQCCLRWVAGKPLLLMSGGKRSKRSSRQHNQNYLTRKGICKNTGLPQPRLLPFRETSQGG